MPFVRINELPPRDTEWLWPGYLPLGHLALLDGDPKVGKSLVTLDLCARLTTGQPFPNGAAAAAPAGVLIVNAEDHARDTLHGRLVAAGADLSRVTVWHRTPDEPWLNLPDDVRPLRQGISDAQAKLVILDPVTAFIAPGVHLSSDRDVRRVLMPLADVAENHRCVIMLIRHLGKTGRGRAMYRGLYSIGFIATCRVAFLAGEDPKMPNRRVLAQQTNNFCAMQPSLAYRITEDQSRQARIEWQGSSPWAADDLTMLGARRDRARGRAGEFLLAFLKDGPRPVKEIYAAARSLDLSPATLRRAREDIDATRHRVGNFRLHATYWMLDGQQLPPQLRPKGIDLEPYFRRVWETFEAMQRGEIPGKPSPEDEAQTHQIGTSWGPDDEGPEDEAAEGKAAEDEGAEGEAADGEGAEGEAA